MSSPLYSCLSCHTTGAPAFIQHVSGCPLSHVIMLWLCHTLSLLIHDPSGCAIPVVSVISIDVLLVCERIKTWNRNWYSYTSYSLTTIKMFLTDCVGWVVYLLSNQEVSIALDKSPVGFFHKIFRLLQKMSSRQKFVIHFVQG